MTRWRGVVVRAARGFIDDDCTDWAAALTYYGVLALFPGAIVVIALVGLVASGDKAFTAIVGMAQDIAPNASVDRLEDVLRPVIQQGGSAKVLLSFGVLGALWSASGYISAFTRATNAVYGVDESRPIYVLRPLQLLVTVVALVLLAVVAVGLVVSGPVAEAVGNAVGAGGAARTAWSVGKWPVLALVAGFLLSLLGWIAPDVPQPRLRWLTVGAAVTLLVWGAVSVGFAFYVANFSSYDVTYGSLGAVIAFLVWLYLSNCAVLLGVEINAEARRVAMPEAEEFAPREPG
jgi:membrane protein